MDSRIVVSINALLDRVSFKNRVFFMLFISNAYISLRRGLVKNAEAIRLRNDRENCRGKPPEDRSGEVDRYEMNHIDSLLPPLHKVLRVYLIHSNVTHALNVIVNTILIFSGARKMAEGGFVALIRCNSPRLVMHDLLNQDWVMWIGFALSLMHLSIRFLMMIYKREFLLDPLLFLLFDKREMPELSDPVQALKNYRQHSALDSIRRLFFYKIEDRHGIGLEFVLKPGRSEKDRALLDFLVDTCFKVAIMSTIFGLILSIPVAIYVFVLKLDFLYPNCSIQDYDLAYLNKILGSMNLTMVFLCDSFLTIYFPVMVSVILAYDLTVYWTRVKLELDKLEDTYSLLAMDSSSYNQSFNYGRTSSKQSKFMPVLCVSKYRELDRKNLNIRSMLGDFFKQVERADEFISINLRFTFGIWVGLNGMISFSGLREVNVAAAYFTAFAQFILFLILLLMSLSVLTLKRRTEPAYKLLCSLMAKDPTPEKDRWLVILKYYTVKPRYAFTLVDSKVFSFGLFLKTFTYTFTFALFVEKFRSS